MSTSQAAPGGSSSTWVLIVAGIGIGVVLIGYLWVNSAPISGVIYAVCLQAPPEGTRKEVVDFLRWATHKGQSFASKMKLTPIPQELVRRIDQKLEQVKTAK
jgi:ABC-type phosphate transport system substrate-binding protein